MTTSNDETDVPASAPTAVEAAVRPDAVRVLSEDEALDWLRSQPGGRVTMSNAELGRQWGGWHRQRVGRWLDAWRDAGLVKRRGDTVTVVGTDGVTNGVTAPVTTGVTGTAVVPVKRGKVARAATPANRLVMRALREPSEATAPTITFVPEPGVATVAAPPPVAAPVMRSTAPWTRVILILIAMGIGTLALIINGQSGWHFGATPLACLTFAGLAVAADLLAMVLPGVAVALWHARHRLLAIGAWLTWPLATGLAMLASLGFIELNVSDTTAGRQAIVTTLATLATQRDDRIAAARTAAAAATRQREAECLKRGPFCRDREADERQALAALATAIAAPVLPAAAIAEADPQVTGALRLATWAGLGIKTDDVKNVRLALMALLPNIAGLLFAFAMGLARPQRRQIAS